MTDNSEPRVVVDAIACIDEAGEKGLVRNLTAARDDDIGVIGSLVFPVLGLEDFRAAFDEPFQRFKTAGAARLKKLHITEAFAPGNEDLRPLAGEVRADIFKAINARTVPILYCARRMRILREGYERMETLTKQAKERRRSKHITLSDHPSTDRVEADLMLGLALRLDAFAQDMELDCIDLLTDDMDLPVKTNMVESLDHGRSISNFTSAVKAFDLNRRKPLTGIITIAVPNAPFELDIKRVGQLQVVGKADPLIFATDVVVNALNDHLTSLPKTSPLNAPESIERWELGSRVLGALTDAAEDRY